MKFYFGFQNFFAVERLAIKFYFISVLTLSEIVLYFSNKPLSSIKKHTHLVFPSELFTQALVLHKHYM